MIWWLIFFLSYSQLRSASFFGTFNRQLTVAGVRGCSESGELGYSYPFWRRNAKVVEDTIVELFNFRSSDDKYTVFQISMKKQQQNSPCL